MPPTQEASAGIFSGVIDFVSREFESFVKSATGRKIESDEDDEEPVASTSQVPDPDTQEQLRINKSRRQRINSKLQRPRRREDGETKARQRRLIPRLSPRKHDDKRRDVEESIIDLPSSHNAHQLHLRRVEVPDDGLEEELSASDHSRSPTPLPPLNHSQRRRDSHTMPGSFSSRSASLQPSPESEHEKSRVVRFVSVTRSPDKSGRTSLVQAELEAGPVYSQRSLSPRASIRQKSHAVYAERTSPLDSESDDSIRIPTPTIGRVKVLDTSQQYSEVHSDSSYKPSLQQTESTLSDQIANKGKGKARAAGERLSDAREFSIATHKESNLRSKERELHNERRRQIEDQEADTREEVDRERDKQRIKMLEEEVKRLKDELARRPVTTSSQPYLIPPPPPPPPMPSTSGSGSRISASQPAALFAKARASLKHTTPPEENPINPSAYPSVAKRKGQPTIGISADKMAAFLNEMKTHRLRRVSSIPDGDLDDPNTSLQQNNDFGNRSEILRTSKPSQSDTSIVQVTRTRGNSVGERIALMESQSHAGGHAQILAGFKRKRAEERTDPNQNKSSIVNRLMNADTLSYNAQSFTERGPSPASSSVTSLPLSTANVSANASSSSIKSKIPLPVRRIRSSASTQSHNRSTPESNTSSSQIHRPQLSPQGVTDLTTPSLCSDTEHGDEFSLEDRSPPPPSVLSVSLRSRSGSTDNSWNKKNSTHVSLPTADAVRSIPIETRQQHSMRMQHELNDTSRIPDAFSRRQPSSVRLDSPRKPRPPAKLKTKKAQDREEQEDYDLVSLPSTTTSEEDVEAEGGHDVSAGPSAKDTQQLSPELPAGSGEALIKAVNRKLSKERERRETLDVELRRATENSVFDAVELESGTFVGVGMRNGKEGFLAHGGSGGIPILMNTGKITSLEDNSEDEQPQPPQKRQRRSSRRRRTTG